MVKIFLTFWFFVNTSFVYASSLCESLFDYTQKTNIRLVQTPKLEKGTLVSLQQALQETNDWEKYKNVLSAVPLNLMQALFITPVDPNNKTLIPTEKNKYSKVNFTISKRPNSPTKELKVIYDVNFGYQTSSGRKILGQLNYILIDQLGNIMEVGGGSKELINEFRNHLFGRKLSQVEINTIREINTKLIQDLRGRVDFKEKIMEFSAQRGWSKGMEALAQIAYYSEKLFPIKTWAQENGYTLSQMRDAGWLKLSFNKYGKPFYNPMRNESIRIPYFDKEDRSLVANWRVRQLGDRDPKYLSWPLNRSIEQPFNIHTEIYNSWDLKKVQGETLVITEGEFKCLIAQATTGIITLGLPGISQLSDESIKTILKAQPKKIVVIFDRDPKASGFRRADNMSDSQRATYQIARRLIDAGATDVKLGTLPDAFEGAKVGIDDLILNGKTDLYLNALQTSVDPDSYLAQYSSSREFQDLIIRKQQIAKFLTHYNNINLRDQNALPAIDLQVLVAYSNDLENAYRHYLKLNFNNAQNIQQISSTLSSLSLVKEIPDQELKVVQASTGENIPIINFDEEIAIMDFLPKDLDVSSCSPAPCVSAPFTKQEILNFINGIEQSSPIMKIYSKGINIASKSKFNPKTKEDFKNVLLAGILSEFFPTDDYQYGFSLTLTKQGSRLTLPITISKKKNTSKISAFSQLRLQGNEDMQGLINFFR